MGIRTTHTLAVLEISQAAYDEIKAKLTEAGYEHTFQESDGRPVIDMHGIAVSPTVDKTVDSNFKTVRASVHGNTSFD